MNNGDKPIHQRLGGDNESRFYGLTKREYLAGLAMQGLMVHFDNYIGDSAKIIAVKSVKMADELLKQLEK